MNHEHCPVVLVHGWRSHPGIWKRLAVRLDEQGIPTWIFDHSGMKNGSTSAVAAALHRYIRDMREEYGYEGQIDVVCHSMGTSAARYLFEVTDGEAHEERVRHLIGIGPLNNGSSMAEIFNDPVHGPEVIRRLAGTFVPHRYRPADDAIAQDLRPGSSVMAALRAAGTRDDIRYRMILGGNHTQEAEFFPLFEGKTWRCAPDGSWETTYAGDGIVPHTDAYLPGAGFDILPLDPMMLQQEPDRYCHLRLPGNQEVIDRVCAYLTNPATRPGGFFSWSENRGMTEIFGREAL